MPTDSLFLRTGYFVPLFILALSGCHTGNSRRALTVDRTKQSYQTVVEKNRELVSAAVAHMQMGQVIEVDESVESQCGGTRARYQISRKEAELHLGVSVYLKADDTTSPQRFEVLAAQATSCSARIEQVWLRYGVHLDLNFTTITDVAYPPDNIVTLHDGAGRSNDLEWYSEDTNDDSSEYCLMALHEIGHLLGLPDEYEEDGTCRTAEYASKDSDPWSVMDDPYRGWDAVDFFPRHFQTILGAVYDPSVPFEPMPQNYELRVLNDLTPQYEQSSISSFILPTSQSLPSDFTLSRGACLVNVANLSSSTGKLLANQSFKLAMERSSRFRSRSGDRSLLIELGQSDGSPGSPRIYEFSCNLAEATMEEFSRLISPYLDLKPLE